MTGHVTGPAAALADELPAWVTLLRAPNPGPMTLDGTNTWVLRRPRASQPWWSTRARPTRDTWPPSPRTVRSASC